jgi:ribose/xylose/arabinose/galactoside ABC-type transport system permease subunit
MISGFAAARATDDPRARQAWLLGLGILLGSELAVVGLFGRNFVSLLNFAELARQTTEIALCAFPLAWIIAAGEVDLAAPGVIAVCAVVLGTAIKPPGLSLVAAIPAVLALGAAAGAAHGFLATGLRLPAGLLTLAGAAVMRGLADGLVVRWRPPPGPLPATVPPLAQHLIFDMLPRPLVALALAAAAFDLARRRIERRGTAVAATRILLHTAVGASAAAAAVLIVARRASARAGVDLGASFALFALTAAVLSGARTPGLPRVGGVVLASLCVATIVNGLPLADVSPPLVNGALGALLLLALATSAASSRSP